MRKMILAAGLLFIMLFLSGIAFAQAGESPTIVWAEYAASESTGQAVWNNVKLYRSNRVSEIKLRLKGEEAFVIPNLQDPSEICFATRPIGEAAYTISSLQDDALTPLFSLKLRNVFAFLGFQDQSVCFVQRCPDRIDSLHTYVVLEATLHAETELARYKSKAWRRPSINANGDMLYDRTDDQSQKIMLRLHSGEVQEVTEGSFPVWYDSHSFLYVLDDQLYQFDLAESTGGNYLTASGKAISIKLNPYSGNALYLTADKKNLIYGVSVEDKLLGFLSSGYFHKAWKVVSLHSGDEYTVGDLEESYDNVHVY